MSHTQEHELGREIPRFERWMGWMLLTFVPALGLVFTPADYDRPLIVATIVLLAIAVVSFLKHTTGNVRGGHDGEFQ
jgi:hypothetical protein